MNAFTLRAVVLSLIGLGVGIGVLSADPPPDSPRSKAVAAIVDLSEHLTEKNVADRAKKVVAEHDSCDISTIFRPKRFGGLGIGQLAPADNRNSIQFLIPELTKKKTLTEEHLEKHQADYVRVAKALQAMAELAPHRGAEFIGSNTKKAKDWADVSADFKKTTAAFRQAVEEKDPKKVRLAAVSLNQTCCNCHVIRDS